MRLKPYMNFSQRVDCLIADCQNVSGSNESKFLCPITFELFERSQLCRGHLIPESQGGVDWIPQVEHVDNFFGATVEASSSSFSKSEPLNEYQILADKELARKTRPTVRLDGKVVDYFPVASQPQGKSTLEIAIGENSALFGTHLSLEECEELCKSGPPRISVEVNKDFSSPFSGMLLHSAHLIMFRMLGYSYALRDECGIRVGKQILGDFYSRSRGDHNLGNRLVEECFAPYKCLVKQLIPGVVETKGTLNDNRVLLALNSNGLAWACLVIIPIGRKLFGVLLPVGEGVTQRVTFDEYLESPFEFVCFSVAEFDITNQNWRVTPNSFRSRWNQPSK